MKDFSKINKTPFTVPFFLACVVSIFLLYTIAYTAIVKSDHHDVEAGLKKEVYEWGLCNYVVNNNTKKLFIPTDIKPELRSFLDHLPAGVQALGCAPIITSVTALDSRITLTWSEPLNEGTISGYKVYRYTVPNGTPTLIRNGGCANLGNVKKCTDTENVFNTTSGAKYYYKVAAVDSNDIGNQSDEVDVDILFVGSSASMSCSDVCSNNNMTCAAVGTNPNGSNGNYQNNSYQNYYPTPSYPIADCYFVGSDAYSTSDDNNYDSTYDSGTTCNCQKNSAFNVKAIVPPTQTNGAEYAYCAQLFGNLRCFPERETCTNSSSGVELYGCPSGISGTSFTCNDISRDRVNLGMDATPYPGYPIVSYMRSVTCSYGEPIRNTPGIITDLSATYGDKKVDLSWSAPSDGGDPITNYKIYRSNTAGFTISIENLIATTDRNRTYIDSNLVNRTTYYYKITAVNKVGEGIEGNEASSIPSTDTILGSGMGSSCDSVCGGVGRTCFAIGTDQQATNMQATEDGSYCDDPVGDFGAGCSSTMASSNCRSYSTQCRCKL